jgi:NADH:ubiquinone oxidoreductase subunit E
VVKPVSKLPTRSPTDEDLDMSRVASMGLELEDIAEGEQVQLSALVELAEDRGRPPSHYVVALVLGSELRLAGSAPLTIKVCAGNCQRYGARDVIDHLVEKWVDSGSQRFSLQPVTCLDRCDQAPACEVHGSHGQLVIAPATKASVDEAIDSL